LFQDSKFMSHPTLANNKQQEYSKIQSQIKEKISDWENKSNELEEIKKVK